MSEESWHLTTSDDGLATLVFDAPGRPHNILTPLALEELAVALGNLKSRDVKPRGLVLKSGKPRGFCAGADLKTILAAESIDELEAYFERGRVVLEMLRRLNLPTVALVHGVCLGGGLELALACDVLALAPGQELRTGTPEINLGLIPGWGAIPELARRIGIRTAVDWLCGGTEHNAEQAAQVGLVEVSQVDEGLADFVGRLTRRLLENPRVEQELEPISSFRTPPLAGPAQERAYGKIMNLLLVDGLQGQEEARRMAVRELARLAYEDDTRATLRRFLAR